MSRRKLVLIVEDDRLIRVLSAELLREEGLVVFEAADTIEALELLEQRAIETACLITDLVMPGSFSGLNLANLVLERWPWIAILVTSGQFSKRPPTLAKEILFLNKPWRPEALCDFAQRATASD